ncbi:LOW QUALITY PROTEIN: uncharacterized protein LOC110907358 [Helianthus annuus]|uniref:LOW QUALITY PROTEIN: uncharacterized protein LOC110907358 n=1 Tax=Helianthus annuus TaxID=4232 RepID=UPI000B908C34|nr:LOW QUALITY PROTEIN: uncharacterized protein LOC110907358 [Helianthus annuus]
MILTLLNCEKEILEPEIVGLYPKGSPSRNSRRPRETQSRGGGLEIVFNQQLTRLGYYLISCVIAPSAKILFFISTTPVFYIPTPLPLSYPPPMWDQSQTQNFFHSHSICF